MTRKITGPEVLTRTEVAQVLGVHPARSHAGPPRASFLISAPRLVSGATAGARSRTFSTNPTQRASCLRTPDHGSQPVQGEPTRRGRMSPIATSEAHRGCCRAQPATAAGWTPVTARWQRPRRCPPLPRPCSVCRYVLRRLLVSAALLAARVDGQAGRVQVFAGPPNIGISAAGGCLADQGRDRALP